MNVMMALGWVGVMLLAGMFFRAKVGLFRNMLVPSSIIGGVLGFILMNLSGSLPLTSFDSYSTMVGQLFTLSFISIGLTSTENSGGADASAVRGNVVKGSIGMGFLWNLLYALTPVVGYFCVKLTGGFSGMDPRYGLLIPFAFAQGPGQSVTYGRMLQGMDQGMDNAAMVGVTFAVVGFLLAFVVGVPLAKAGLKRGLGLYSKKLNPAMAKGLYPKEEQTVSTGTTTTHSGNIDTLAFHVALVGLSYVLTYLVTLLVTTLIPSTQSLMWGMMFMTGMVMSYLIKWVMKLCKITYIHDNSTQKRITNWSTDFLVVASFMAVQLEIVSQWAVPILFTCLVVGALTYVFCLYFGKRFGGANDFERTLGVFGTATGTVPTGIALVRIVDPELQTTTAVELGAMNLPMTAAFVTLIPILGMGGRTMSEPLGLLLLLAPIPVYLIIMKVCRVWGKKTYDFKGAPADQKGGDQP